MFCRPEIEYVYTSAELDKKYGACGKYLTLCGFGLQHVHFKLGTDQDEALPIWFRKKYADDVIEVWQYDVPITIAPNEKLEGSFAIDWAPFSEEDDEITIVFRGNHRDSAVDIKVSCPAGCVVINPGVEPPRPTEMECGRTKIQAGFVGQNTLLMGDESGWVDIFWEVSGSALIQFYQEDDIVHVLKSNRSDEKTIWFDHTKGNLVVQTHGTGNVSYVVSCPYLIEEPEIPTYAITCGNTETYTAPLNVDIVFANTDGLVQFDLTLEETVGLTFIQGTTVFYQVQQYEGRVEFSYDYVASAGQVYIQATGYGDFGVFVTCPEIIPDPDPEELEFVCAPTFRTIPGNSNTKFLLGDTNGNVTIDFQITNEVYLYVGANYSVISKSGPVTFEWRGEKVRVDSRGADYQIRVACPIPFPPKDLAITCGATPLSYTGPANVTINFGNSPLGNAVINSQRPVAVYKNNILVNVGTQVLVLHDGSTVVAVTALEESNQISVTCPSIKVHNCGNSFTTYNANDVIDVRLNNIRGHTEFSVEITGNVTLTWRRNSSTFRTSTANETFTILHNASDTFRVISTGTGTFRIRVRCTIPPYIVSSETINVSDNCPPGQTVGGQYGGSTVRHGSYVVHTWSDGTTTQTAITWQGACMIEQDLPIPPARFGVGMFSNRQFTGGPIASEVTQEELDWGLSLTHAPEGTPYKHWTGLEDFVADVMTGRYTPTQSHVVGNVFNVTLRPDHYAYFMWDARAGDIEIIDARLGFITSWNGILWRNDWFGNNEGMPEYDPNLPTVLEVMFDDGNGPRAWKIVRMESYPFSPSAEIYSVRYK